MTSSDEQPKIPKDLREWYDSLIHRRNQCLKRGRLMQRAEFWMDYEDTFVSLIERIATAEARVAELETQLDALQWTPITAENMPKQGDELLGRCGNGVYYVNEYGGLADYAQLVAEEEWTHFRPINAPQSGGSR